MASQEVPMQDQSNSSINVATSISDLPTKCSRYTHRVYAIQFSDGSLKVGMTENLAQRARTLSADRASLGIPSSIRCVAYSPECYNAATIERSILDKSIRLHGEYVGASFATVLNAMSLACYDYVTEEGQKYRDERSEYFLNGLKTLIGCNLRKPDQEKTGDAELALFKSIIKAAQQDETLNRWRAAQAKEIVELLIDAHDNMGDLSFVSEILLTCVEKVAKLGGLPKESAHSKQMDINPA